MTEAAEVDMKSWLEQLGIQPGSSLLAALAEERVDVAAMKLLGTEDLKELGFKLGERAKLSQGLQGFQARRYAR